MPSSPIRVTFTAVDIARRLDPSANFEMVREWWASARPFPREHFRLITGRNRTRPDSLYRVTADHRAILIAGKIHSRSGQAVTLSEDVPDADLHVVSIIILSTSQRELVDGNLEFLMSLSDDDGIAPGNGPTRPRLGDPATLTPADRDRAARALRLYKMLLALAQITSGPDYEWTYEYERALQRAREEARRAERRVSAPPSGEPKPNKMKTNWVLWELTHILADMRDAGVLLPPAAGGFFDLLSEIRPGWREKRRPAEESTPIGSAGVDGAAMPE